jgi:hypothetical protein
LIFGFNGTRDYIFNIVAECKVDDWQQLKKTSNFFTPEKSGVLFCLIFGIP